MSFVMCRTLGHSWFPIDSEGPPPERGGTPMWFRCERCDMERRDIIWQATGDLVSRRYVPPTDYYGAYSRDWRRSDFRLELLKELHRRKR